MNDADAPPLITECPNCRTRFRVSEEQLAVAHGRVRCGACLAVFPGIEHLLHGAESITGTHTSPDTLEAVLAELTDAGGLDVLDDDEDEIDGGEGSRGDTVSAAALETIADDEGGERAPTDWTEAQIDTQAMTVLARHERRPTLADAMEDEEALRGWLEGELTGEHQRTRQPGAPEDRAAEADHAGDEDLELDGLLDSDDRTDRAALAELERLLREFPEEAAAAAASEAEDREVDTATAAPSSAGAADPAETVTSVSANAPVVDASMARGAQRSEIRTPRELPGWRLPQIKRPLRLASIIAFVVLTIQVLYFQFDSWSKTSVMRPVYAALCTVLPCELETRRDLSLLESQKLTVRAHPELPETLLVDALIVNLAEFDQPYPLIELEFMDLERESLAIHRLLPEQYLEGEASSEGLMPARTPVHIDIEIPDPGAAAVNYQLTFR